MDDILSPFRKSFRDLFSSRIFLILVAPTLIALIFWISLLWINWSDWVHLLATVTAEFLGSWDWLARSISSSTFMSFSVLMISISLVLAVIPMTLMTSMILSSLFSTPLLVREIRKRSYPQVIPSNSISVYSAINSVKSFALYLVLWIFCLPFLWIPIGGFLLTIFLNAWISRMIIPVDVLSELLPKERTKKFIETHSTNLWSIGWLTGLLTVTPLIFFVAPLFGTLMYTHYILEKWTPE